MMIKTSRKRFIAGATCPQCGEIDKVFTQIRSTQAPPGVESCQSENKVPEKINSADIVEEKERGCVSCDFLEVISDLEQEPEQVTGDWSPVKLLE